MTDISKLIAELSPEQLELLKLNLDRISDKIEEPRVSLAPRTHESDIFPLSYAQQRFWFLHHLNPDSSAYNIPFAVRLKGALDAAALEQTFREILRRHKVLNTFFTSVDGQPMQVIAPVLAGPLIITQDLRHLQAGVRETEMRRLVTENAEQPFDLTRAPLLRARLLRLSDDEHVLVLALDHIATDAGSAGILLEEMATLYCAFAAGQPSPLPELPLQYADFAHWQHEWLEGEVMNSQLDYWRQQLAGAPAGLDLPSDRPRSQTRDFQLASYTLEIPETLALKIRDFSQRENVTLFMTFFAAFNALLYLYSGQSDILIATPVSNRNRPELQSLIGCFINHLIMRTACSPEVSFRELLAQVRETTLSAHAHQDLPFEKLVAELRPDRKAGRDPLLQVVFNLYDSRRQELVLPGLKVEPIELKLGTISDLDLRMIDTERGLVAAFRYDAALFDGETVEHLAASFVAILETVTQRPATTFSQLALSDQLRTRVEAALIREQSQTIVVAATFTADPIQESLAFWMQEFDVPAQIEIAPYNQLFQQLLDPASQLAQNRHGINIVLVRLQDWLFQREPQAGSETETNQTLQINTRDFVLALKAAVTHSPTPFLVCLCPSTPDAKDQSFRPDLFKSMEGFLISELDSVDGVYLVTESELLETYPVASFYDAYRDKLGHVPFQPVFFTALGTMIARKIYALRSAPYKVLVLDADQTLWRGIVAEDGVAGIEITSAHAALQRFVVVQQQAGMLICLCSKNNENDVVEVFKQHPEMPLRREHLASWRINWIPKSQNLRALSAELEQGLESFIFIDDDPVECAEVETHCPEVLSLQLPQDRATIPRFLKHVWAFSNLKITDEDRKRTALYRQNVERKRFRQESLTFEEFLSSLELEVEIGPLEPPAFRRISQLTNRTNQFNTTTIRRSESELQQLWQSPDFECYVVRVKDRFGEYGLVGAMFIEATPTAVKLETFLLSCRVLGRGVEHQMLVKVAQIAQTRDLARVDVPYDPTERNRPALNFLESVGATFRETFGNSYIFKFPAEVIIGLRHQPIAAHFREGAAVNAAPVRPPQAPAASSPQSTARTHFKPSLIRRIATELFDAERINQVIEEQRRQALSEVAQVFVAPRTPIEAKLAEIWKRILGVERVGTYDNFFKLGGHSLQGTLLMSRVSDAFQVELPLLSLFEAPTIAALAQAIKLRRVEEASLDELDRLLKDLDGLSDEEVRASLAEEE